LEIDSFVEKQQLGERLLKTRTELSKIHGTSENNEREFSVASNSTENETFFFDNFSFRVSGFFWGLNFGFRFLEA